MENNFIKNFFTPQEVAEELQLNTLTVYSYIKRKKLLAVKIGRNYRIAKEDLSKFIESNKTY
jgi:excisionase family DNA binding protein